MRSLSHTNMLALFKKRLFTKISFLSQTETVTYKHTVLFFTDSFGSKLKRWFVFGLFQTIAVPLSNTCRVENACHMHAQYECKSMWCSHWTVATQYYYMSPTYSWKRFAVTATPARRSHSKDQTGDLYRMRSMLCKTNPLIVLSFDGLFSPGCSLLVSDLSTARDAIININFISSHSFLSDIR